MLNSRRNSYTKQFILRIGMACLVSSYFGCRQSGGEDSETSAVGSIFSGNRSDVSTSLTSQAGSPAQMAGWVVAFFEKDSRSARISVADANGNLKFTKMSLDAFHGAVLLSPDYLIQSVLTLPSSKDHTVRQFFRTNRPTLPRLVQRGSVVNFQSIENLTIDETTAIDSNDDGVPDGMDGLGLGLDSTFSLNGADTDRDGTINTNDIDIDGDGLFNPLDPDDDGDGILDIVDSDSNGDGIPDSVQTSTDQHYAVGLEYLAVQTVVTPSSQNMKFVAKVRDGVLPTAVRIRGASSLLANSTFTQSDGTSGTWDFSLADDGSNDDATAGDGLYARSVALTSGLTVRANQVIFFQLMIGIGDDQFPVEYAYTLPNLATAIPTANYDAATRSVTLVGEPFGQARQDFLWLIAVSNSSGIKMYESNSVVGTTRSITLPANILVPGQNYTYKATAQLLDKVPGYPAMIVHSATGTISN
jgi:hypothetical protein